MINILDDNSLDCLYWRYFVAMLDAQEESMCKHKVKKLLDEAVETVNETLIKVLEET